MSKFQLVSGEDIDDHSTPEKEPYSGVIHLDTSDEEGVCIELDGRVGSDLDWNSQIEQATLLASRGANILWKLNLGLFADLPHPLSNESQLLTLRLSVDHFCQTIWARFKTSTIGVVLYEGDVTFSDLTEVHFEEWKFEHNAQHLNPEVAHAYYRRDVAAEYLVHFVGFMPESLRIFLMLSVPDTLPLSVAIALLNPDRFDRIQWILEGRHILNASLARQGNKLVPISLKHHSAGFCVPFPEWMPDQPNSVDALIEKHPNIRLVAEGAIISNWELLDEIYVLENFLTPFGKRQLLGFNAAGGLIIYLQKNL